jgi:hypothetical protein
MNYQEKIDELTDSFYDIAKPLLENPELREKLNEYEALNNLFYKLTLVLFSSKFQETITEEEINEIEECVNKIIAQLILFYMENKVKIEGLDIEEKEFEVEEKMNLDEATNVVVPCEEMEDLKI